MNVCIFARVHGSGSSEPSRPSMTASTYVRVVRPAHSIQFRVCVPARAHSSRVPHTQSRFLTPPHGPGTRSRAPALPYSRARVCDTDRRTFGRFAGQRSGSSSRRIKGIREEQGRKLRVLPGPAERTEVEAGRVHLRVYLLDWFASAASLIWIEFLVRAHEASLAGDLRVVVAA
jgi:hypothetical protein